MKNLDDRMATTCRYTSTCPEAWLFKICILKPVFALFLLLSDSFFNCSKG